MYRVWLDDALDILHVPHESLGAVLLPNLRDCGVYFGTHPELCPKLTCFSHDLLILKAIQIHCQACLQVAFSSMEVQRHVAQHIHHDVEALLLPQLRHDDTLPHLAKELACLPIGVLALHVLVEISVWRLSNRRDTAAMRNEDIAARPAQCKYLWREVRRIIIGHDDPPSPRPLLIDLRQVLFEECEHVGLAVRAFFSGRDRHPRSISATADVLRQTFL